MLTQQQSQVLQYFREHADAWRQEILSEGERTVNVTEQRNGYVLHVIKNRPKTRAALDVGCGTGELTWAIARLGIAVTGVDFADEMIWIARGVGEANAAVKPEFHCCSVFDFDFSRHKYDVIAANGFIEYISLQELHRFLELAHNALSPGGSLVVNSRNRLFNIFSLNSFTADEIDKGAITPLLREAVAIAQGSDLAGLAKIEAAPLQGGDTQLPETGIAVSTRFQYTPGQLIKIVKSRGFDAKELYPCHIHGIPPAFKDRHPEVHKNVSNLLQHFAFAEPSLAPFASTFSLHAARE